MCKLAFVISNSKTYYDAGTKPFVDLSIGLMKLKNIKIKSFILFFRSPSYYDTKRKFSELQLYYFQNLEEINNFIEKKNIQVVVTDDFLPRINLVKNLKAKTKIIYAQVLLGLGAINRLANKASLKLRLTSYIPWPFLTRPYIKALNEADIVIGNSYTTTHYLASLYGISSSGVVYPPVGVNLIPPKEERNRQGILVYTGHKPDFNIRDTDRDISVLEKIDKVTVWGDNGIKNLSDEELSKLYSSSRLVYSATSFELFGYVGAEALLFRTPVLLSVYEPFLEKIPLESNMVKILGRDILSEYDVLKFLELKKDADKVVEAIKRYYAAEASAAVFAEILEKNIVCN